MCWFMMVVLNGHNNVENLVEMRYESNVFVD